MTDDRNPELQALFADTEEDLQAVEFTSEVMTGIEGLKRRRLILLTGLGLVAILALWFLATPLQDAVLLLATAFGTPLVNLGNPLFDQMLLPVNNAASIGVLGLLFVGKIYRKLFHRP